LGPWGRERKIGGLHGPVKSHTLREKKKRFPRGGQRGWKATGWGARIVGLTEHGAKKDGFGYVGLSEIKRRGKTNLKSGKKRPRAEECKRKRPTGLKKKDGGATLGDKITTLGWASKTGDPVKRKKRHPMAENLPDVFREEPKKECEKIF